MAEAAWGQRSLVGRHSELAGLQQWLAETLAGNGRLILLTGPPGIGKTRLVEELASGARRDGQRVLWGCAVEERGTPPLWPWRRILEAVSACEGVLSGSGGFDSARSDELVAARFRAAATVASALIAAADATGLLIVLEDLQWADHESLFVLRELASELPGSRLMVVATCRDTASYPGRPSLGDLVRLPGLRMLRLTPLAEAEVAGVLLKAGVSVGPELARFVHVCSGGNPLYVTTLARLLATQPGAVPSADTVARIVGGSAEVSHLIRSLLRDLDESARVVLAAASVLGGDFDSDLAGAVCGASEDVTGVLAAAEARGLVTRQPDRPGCWRFSHALVRDGTYASLSEGERMTLHHRAAVTLEPLARESPERGGEVAAHLLLSAQDRAVLQQAADWAATAATAATGGLAFEDAARYLATAIAAAEGAGAGEAERANLLIELATAQYRAGQFAASLEHVVAAADAAERAGRLDLAANAALVVRGIGHPQVAATLLELCDRALVNDGCPRALQARLLAQRAFALAELGDSHAAAQESAAAMAIATAEGDPAAELDAIRARVAALSAPQNRAERLRLGTRAVQLATLVHQPLAAVLGHVWRIDASYEMLDMKAVDAGVLQIAHLAESTRLPLARWHLLRQQASHAALIGQLALARDRSRQAHKLAVRLQDRSGAGVSNEFAVWLAIIRGDAGEIPEDLFDTAVAAPPLAIIRACLARALFAVGRTEDAQAVYETLRQLPAAGGKDRRDRAALAVIMDLITAFGDTEMAQATYDLFSRHLTASGTTGTGVVVMSGSRHWPLGRLAALLGDTDEALSHYAAAAAVNSRLGARPFVILTRLDWADALKTRGTCNDQAQARELARRAAAEARRLDMPGPAARAEQLVHGLDRLIPASDPLTPREREIAELVSPGSTNRAIADQLVISERTVEGHVHSILAKLQLTNRTELAAWSLRGVRP